MLSEKLIIAASLVFLGHSASAIATESGVKATQAVAVDVGFEVEDQTPRAAAGCTIEGGNVLITALHVVHGEGEATYAEESGITVSADSVVTFDRMKSLAVNGEKFPVGSKFIKQGCEDFDPSNRNLKNFGCDLVVLVRDGYEYEPPFLNSVSDFEPRALVTDNSPRVNFSHSYPYVVNGEFWGVYVADQVTTPGSSGTCLMGDSGQFPVAIAAGSTSVADRLGADHSLSALAGEDGEIGLYPSVAGGFTPVD